MTALGNIILSTVTDYDKYKTMGKNTINLFNKIVASVLLIAAARTRGGDQNKEKLRHKNINNSNAENECARGCGSVFSNNALTDHKSQKVAECCQYRLRGSNISLTLTLSHTLSRSRYSYTAVTISVSIFQ